MELSEIHRGEIEVLLGVDAERHRRRQGIEHVVECGDGEKLQVRLIQAQLVDLVETAVDGARRFIETSSQPQSAGIVVARSSRKRSFVHPARATPSHYLNFTWVLEVKLAGATNRPRAQGLPPTAR